MSDSIKIDVSDIQVDVSPTHLDTNNSSRDQVGAVEPGQFETFSQATHEEHSASDVERTGTGNSKLESIKADDENDSLYSDNRIQQKFNFSDHDDDNKSVSSVNTFIDDVPLGDSDGEIHEDIINDMMNDTDNISVDDDDDEESEKLSDDESISDDHSFIPTAPHSRKPEINKDLLFLVNNRAASAVILLENMNYRHIDILKSNLVISSFISFIFVLSVVGYEFIILDKTDNGIVLADPSEYDKVLDLIRSNIVIRTIFSFAITCLCILMYYRLFSKLLIKNATVVDHPNPSSSAASDTNNNPPPQTPDTLWHDFIRMIKTYNRRRHVFMHRLRYDKMLILSLLICSWLTPMFNPIVIGFDWRSFDKLEYNVTHPINDYYYDYKRFHYNAVFNTIFLSIVFYGTLYLLKHYRLSGNNLLIHPDSSINNNSIVLAKNQPDLEVSNKSVIVNGGAQAIHKKPSKALDEIKPKALSTAVVRATRGSIPRMVALYFVLRLVLGSALSFDMGFVPCLSWISVIKICGHDETDCSSGLNPSRIVLIVLFNIFELFLVLWTLLESYRTRDMLQNLMILESRNLQIGYYALSVINLHWISLILIGSILVGGTSDTLLPEYTLQYVGVQSYYAGFSITLVSYLFCLSWAFLPANSFGISGWFKPTDPLKSYDRLYCRNNLIKYYPSLPDSAIFEDSSSDEAGFNWSALAGLRRPSDSSIGNHEEDEDESSDLNSVDDMLLESAEKGMIMNNLSTIEEFKADDSMDSSTLAATVKDVGDHVVSSEDDTSEPSDDSEDPDVRSTRKFVFDTVCLLWNISYITYLTGTIQHQQTSKDVQDLIEDDDYKVVEQFFDEGTATYVLVLKNIETDRIVVSFRGNCNLNPNQTTFMIPKNKELIQHAISNSKYNDWNHILYGSYHENRTHLFNCCKRCMLNYKKPMVHAGLWNTYLNIRLRLFQCIGNLYSNQEGGKCSIYVTGHGIGGGLATFCTLDLKTVFGINRVACYTFGSPRVGNQSFRLYYNSIVRVHFNIANVGDSMSHSPAVAPFRLALGYKHVGSGVVFDHSGNLLLHPDKVERSIMRKMKRQIYNPHTPLAYTLSIMQWVYRLHRSSVLPLWSSCLHDVKLNCRKEILSGYNIHSYLQASHVGVGQYQKDQRIQANILRISGVNAEKIYCVATLRVDGCDARLYEVAKTTTSDLRRRSQVLGLNMNYSPTHRRGHSGEHDSPRHQDEFQLVRQSSHRRHHSSLDHHMLDNREQLASSRFLSSSYSSSERNIHGGSSGRSRNLTSGSAMSLTGVDVEALSSMPAKFTTWSDEPIVFGYYQKVRACSCITVTALDGSKNSFNKVLGTCDIYLNQLKPGLTNKLYEYTFPLVCNGAETNGELLIEIGVLLPGEQLFESSNRFNSITNFIDNSMADYNLLNHQNSPHMNALNSSLNTSNKSANSNIMSTTPTSLPRNISKKNKKVTLSRAMATYCIKHQIIPDTKRITLKVGLMRAIIPSSSSASTSDLSIKCEVVLGNQNGISKKAKFVKDSDIIHFNEVFTFGRLEVLTGFENIVIKIQTCRSDNDDQHFYDLYNEQSKDITMIGLVTYSIGLILKSYHGETIIKWLPIEQSINALAHGPKKQKELFFDNKNSSGQLCLSLDVDVESIETIESELQRHDSVKAMDEQSNSNTSLHLNTLEHSNSLLVDSQTNSSKSAADTEVESLAPLPPMNISARRIGRQTNLSNMMRNASGSLRNLVLGSSTGNNNSKSSANLTELSNESSPSQLKNKSQRINRDLSKMTKRIAVSSTPASENLIELSSRKCDERTYTVRIRLIKGINISCPLVRQDSFKSSVSNTSSTNRSLTSTYAANNNNSVANPFCVVEIIDKERKKDDTEVNLLKAKTAVLRGTTSPEWDEEYSFGFNRDAPVRGNEVISISVYYWTRNSENENDTYIGNYSIQISKFLKSFDVENEVLKWVDLNREDKNNFSKIYCGITVSRYAGNNPLRHYSSENLLDTPTKQQSCSP